MVVTGFTAVESTLSAHVSPSCPTLVPGAAVAEVLTGQRRIEGNIQPTINVIGGWAALDSDSCLSTADESMVSDRWRWTWRMEPLTGSITPGI